MRIILVGSFKQVVRRNIHVDEDALCSVAMLSGVIGKCK